MAPPSFRARSHVAPKKTRRCATLSQSSQPAFRRVLFPELRLCSLLEGFPNCPLKYATSSLCRLDATLREEHDRDHDGSRWNWLKGLDHRSCHRQDRLYLSRIVKYHQSKQYRDDGGGVLRITPLLGCLVAVRNGMNDRHHVGFSLHLSVGCSIVMSSG